MTRLVRVAVQPPLPEPVPAANHLAVQDEGPVLPRTRKVRARRANIQPVAPRPLAAVEPLTAPPGAPEDPEAVTQ